MDSAEKIRVIVALPGAMLRAGLRAMLEDIPGVVLDADAAVFDRLPELAAVDVIVIGGQADSIADLMRFLEDRDISAAVLAIADAPGMLSALSQLALPGWGLLPHDCTLEELELALQAVRAGLAVGPAEPMRDAMKGHMAGVIEPALTEPLTDREMQVLQLLARGLANKMIAGELGISENTVKFHVSAIYGKLNAANRTEAVRFGLQGGLITV